MVVNRLVVILGEVGQVVLLGYRKRVPHQALKGGRLQTGTSVPRWDYRYDCYLEVDVVSRVSRKRRVIRTRKTGRKLQRLRLHACGVSRAWWPPHMRRCIATSKSAQRRRLFIMRGVWWLHPEYTLYRYIFPSLIVSLLLVGGVFLAATMILHWPLLILLSSLWLITAIGIPLLLFNEISGKVEIAMPDSCAGEAIASPIAQQPKRAEQVEQPVQGVYTQYLPALHIMPPATTLPPETVVAMQSSPETPMPMAPLVRVLETIDLSSSGVEHFLDTSFEYHSLPVSSQGNEIPRSERGVERVEIPKSERGMTFG